MMRSGTIRLTAAAALGAMALLCGPGHALAQQPKDEPAPERSASECEKRVADLEKQLEQYKERVRELTKQNDDLRSRLKDAGVVGGGGPKAPPKSETTDPLSSPQAMFDALVKSYDEVLKPMPRSSRPEQAKFAIAAKDWARDHARSMRGPVDWTIEVQEVLDPVGGSRGAPVIFTVLDTNGKPVGEPFSQLLAPRFHKIAKDAGKGAKLRLQGTAEPKPAYNPLREEKGTSDEPKFVGPFIEFTLELAVSDLKPAS